MTQLASQPLCPVPRVGDRRVPGANHRKGQCWWPSRAGAWETPRERTPRGSHRWALLRCLPIISLARGGL